MRLGWWALLGVLGIASLAQAQNRSALLVAIDDYSFITDARFKLKGADLDLQYMTALCQFGGFTVATLKNDEATRAAIETVLTKLEQNASRGDEVLFYFSGRGSVAPDPDSFDPFKDMEVTLVPHDGQEASAIFDLRMRRLARFAQTIEGKGGRVTLILDTCFRPLTSRSGQYRHYNDVPKCVLRNTDQEVSVKQPIYSGPGTFLCATGAPGAAYEWLTSDTDDTWAGAFTHELAGIASVHIQNNTSPTMAELMMEVQASVLDRERQGYMPGFRPIPPAEVLYAKAEPYGRRSIFSQPGAQPTDPAKARVEAASKQRAEQTEQLRVGFQLMDSVPESERAGLEAKVFGTLGAQLERSVATLKLVRRGGLAPDRLVEVSKEGDKWHAVVPNEPTDDPDQKPRFAADSFEGLFSTGLAEYFERSALIYRLFRLADTAEPTLSAAIRIDTSADTVRHDDLMTLTVRSSIPSSVYLLDLDGAGLVKYSAPIRVFPDTSLKPASSGYELSLRGRVERMTAVGPWKLRAIVVQLPEGVTLPSLDVAESEYPKALLAHLKELLRLIESGKARWRASTKKVDVVQ